MAPNHDLPPTDSAAVLHKMVGDDATAVFESDPKFMDGNAGEVGSSENLQSRTDREDIRSQPSLRAAAAAKDDEDEEDEDVDDEDDDVEDDDEEDDDVEEDEDDEDDEDEDEEEDYDDDEDDDEDDEDEES